MMTPDMERLFNYAKRFGKNGEWLANGEDAVESLLALAEKDLVVLNDSNDRWRLHEDEIVHYEFTVPVNDYSDNCVNEVERVDVMLNFDQLQILIDRVVVAVETDELDDLKDFVEEQINQNAT